MVMKVEFKSIVGKDSVTDQPKVMKEYAQDHSFVASKKPSLVVKPGSADEVQRLITLAKRRRYKLVPVSSGAPRFRGDTVPAVDNAIIVDMSGMNKIEWVNRRNRVALVEPGVTFGELEKELEKEGLRGMMPLLPRENKSVIGAYLEREPFTIPKYAWDMGDPVASSEMILGDGYKMRTGGGAGPEPTLEGQRRVDGAQKLPMSPFTMDPRRIIQGSQGGMAICTWMSFRCELLPEHEKIYFVASDDLNKINAAAKRFLYLRLTDEQYILNNLNFACLLEKDAKKIEGIRKKLPPWILVLSIGGYGYLAKEQFDYKDGDLQDEAKKLGIKLESEIGGIEEKDYRKKVVRKVSSKPYWKMRYKGDCREMFFITNLSKTPDFIETARDMAVKAGFKPDDIGV